MCGSEGSQSFVDDYFETKSFADDFFETKSFAGDFLRQNHLLMTILRQNHLLMTILRNNHHYFVDEMKKKVFAVNQKQTWPPVSLNSDLNCINKWGLYSFQPTRAKGYYTCKL